MSDNHRYAWDFDRPPASSLEIYETFSVGIFQWQQKASGKGLKKSKAMSRVLGYTAEAERVYEKAIEICARLNRERASADDPPTWLRKQFSIPRPGGMVIERTSDDFTGAQVRDMRLKVMKQQLLPAGFVVGKDATYVRRDGDQIHLINFQAGKYGHDFTVNLGFHYAFIPPLFHQRPQGLSDFHLLDCMLHTRIASFLPPETEHWFKYGNDRDKLIATLTLCAKTCLTAFEQLSERWRDPSALLSDYLEDFSSTGTNARWYSYDDHGFGWIELKTGRIKEAELRLAKWADREIKWQRPRNAMFKEMLSQLQHQGSRKGHQVTWKDWVE